MARVTKLQGVLREKQDVLERRRTQPLPDASQNTNETLTIWHALTR